MAGCREPLFASSTITPPTKQPSTTTHFFIHLWQQVPQAAARAR